MKCPSCSNAHKRGAGGMKCSSCGYTFVYDPKANAKISDVAVLSAAREASNNFTHTYSDNQLRTAMSKRIRGPSSTTARVLAAFLAGAGFSVAIVAASVFPAVVGFLAAAATLAIIRAPLQWNDKRLDMVMAQWPTLYGKHGATVRGELVSHAKRLESRNPTGADEDDIFDYGVERLLIVDDDRLVDLLVANEFHAELRVLILSTTGYPLHLMEQAKRVVRERQDLPVFTVHGTATDSVAPPSWLDLSRHSVVDIGFSLRDFRMLPRFSHTRQSATLSYPVDALPNATLTSVLERCMQNGEGFGSLLERGGANGVDFDLGASAVVGDFG